MRKRLIGAVVLVGLIGLSSQFRLVRVEANDMAPGLRTGDWVLLGPGSIKKGDIYRLEDPNDPSRQVFRRVLATPGDEVSYKSGRLKVNNESLRVREMAQQDGFSLRSEANAWLVRRRATRDRSPGYSGTLGETDVFVMADSRDEAIDSRWWGPIESKNLGRRVWYRWGESDTWRDDGTWYGRDGPWRVPPPQAPGPNAVPTRPATTP